MATSEGINIFESKAITKVRGRQYWSISDGENTFYLEIVKGVDYLFFIRNYTQWEETFNKLKTYSYVDARNSNYQNDGSERVLSDYIPIQWLSIVPPEYNRKVQFKYRTDRKEYCVAEASIGEMGFVSESDFQIVKQEEELKAEKERELAQHRADSLRDIKPIPVQLRLTDNVKRMQNRLNSGGEDELYLNGFAYCYNPSSNTISVVIAGEECEMALTDVDFTNSSDLLYLNTRGEGGRELRKTTAHCNDNISYAKYRETLYNRELQKQYHATQDSLWNARKDFYNAKKLCIIDISTFAGRSRNEVNYQVTFYNCYKKTIKYLNWVVSPFNRVNDIHPDARGHKEDKANWIGPLDPGNGITLVGPEGSFYDGGYGTLHSIQIVSLEITFMDNSKITYSNYAEVQKHCACNY